ncbi:MAG: hypothetical protein ACI379_08105 [Nocardioides sp.]|uniref:hypothetical protein n=1 Tax=Nocardioides sp. TaxID=35761 RepID=UPI003F08601C
MSATDTPRRRAEPKRAAKPAATERSVAENRLGLRLVAPAVILMLLVTAWPMIQALWLSLFRYRLTAHVSTFLFCLKGLYIISSCSFVDI